MTGAVDARRRRALSAVAAAAVLVGPSIPTAGAQDPRASAGQSAARTWLAITDRHDAAGSYSAAGAKFREAMTADRWAAALKAARDPLGAVERRAVVGTRFQKAVKGFPPGEYVVIQFRSTFAKRMIALETVTLERDANGTWRVIGYLLS
jgi:hypothetical protein